MAQQLNLFTLKTKRNKSVCLVLITQIVFLCFQMNPSLVSAEELDIDLAYAYQSKGQYFKANSIFFRALNEGVYLEESHYGLAKGYVSVNKQNEAMKQVDKLLAINPQHVKGLMLKSTLLLQSGDAESAISYLETLKQLDSKNPEVWLQLENTYALLGDDINSKAAMSEYDRLLMTGK